MNEPCPTRKQPNKNQILDAWKRQIESTTTIDLKRRKKTQMTLIHSGGESATTCKQLEISGCKYSLSFLANTRACSSNRSCARGSFGRLADEMPPCMCSLAWGRPLMVRARSAPLIKTRSRPNVNAFEGRWSCGVAGVVVSLDLC